MDIEKIIDELTQKEKAGLCSGHDFWTTKPVSRLGIPAVMMCDGPHGLRKQLGEGDHLGINESIETVCYPSASALASSFDREVLSQMGDALGRECQAEGVSMLLGPGLNIKRSPLCGRNFEYFSEDPYLAGELGAAYVSALQGKGIAACVKHFAANSQETRRMSSSSNMDERTLHEIYLPAFEAAVKKGGTRAVMCAYNAVNGTFCAENRTLLTEILREKWGYQGMVVTDWGAVKDRVKGLLAGLDLEMPGGPGTQDEAIVQAVRDGTLEESVLDKAVEHVLRFVEESTALRKEDTEIDRTAFGNLSVELSAQCAVLLKNDGILPLSRSENAVFIGEFARRPRFQGGGSSHINAAQTVNALDAVQRREVSVSYVQGYDTHDGSTEEGLIAEAVEAARNADIAVIFAGLPDFCEAEGADRTSLAMPENQNRLIEAVAAVNPNTVVVLHTGAPVELPWLNKVKAVLCMYLGGQGVGEAVVRLLYGEAVPSGKLAETWPLRLEDTPCSLWYPGEGSDADYREGVYVGYRYYDKKKMDVLFPFGYGLSYTSFAYSGLKLDKENVEDTEELTVTCTVKNTGTLPGSEAVQLYIRDTESSAGRPVRELKGFEKVFLLPGEERAVSFRLDKRAFAWYEPKIHDWYVESGVFSVEIGSSSRDIRLCAEVNVIGTSELPLIYTPDSIIGDLLKTEKGRTFVEKMLGQGLAASQENNRKTMGEGAAATVLDAAMGMPMRSLVTFGRMTAEQLDGLLMMLNG